MVANRNFEKKKRMPKIPDNLIWETLDGQPLYRRGYKDVLRKLKTYEEIMGTSSWQSLLCDHLTRLLHRYLDELKYDVLSNVGVHIEKGTNVSTDICIVPRLTPEQINKKYVHFAPKVVLEVDLDIDTEDINDLEYVHKKTQRLLDFGVEKLIRIFTFSKKIIIATPNNDWVTTTWNKDIEILDGIVFNIQKYLDERGIDINNL